ncbi:apoptosis antagonizing transcription factor-domain-containing protein [Lineolata rhizophorae]|uniref:Protein BFR2 n=1 Tax=Lineolata rhizophorae TaxID=578093 RepID=A0A6A6NQK8_9PEZI|nr:apoptosis antagonizing transcription factor-domain-containing protein [Lineolata rhizophorae]
MTGPKRPRSLAEQIADLEDPTPKEYDPEALADDAGEESDSRSDVDEGDEHDAREHYVTVGKSKLRKQDIAPLGPQYAGSRVGRDTTFDEDSDDPFSKGFDEETSDEDERENNVEKDKINGHATQGEVNSENQSKSDEEIEEEDAEGPVTDDTNLEEEDEGEDSEIEDGEEEASDTASDIVDRAELRRIMREEQKSVAASVSQAAKADAEKGVAVKKQRATFDTLLNIRIRLQKALAASNSMQLPDTSRATKVADPPHANGHDEHADAAYAAAFNLWNSLTELRNSLESARTGEKRKRPAFDQSTPTNELWRYMEDQEADVMPYRREILSRWANRSRGASAIQQGSRLMNGVANKQELLDVLDAQLVDPSDRLLKRARMVRSCAPQHAARGITESGAIYDDADFYGLLLKELLERRSEEGAAAAEGVVLDVQQPWQVNKQTKAKRIVDTKASKGRKLRYTVHEKLQNFLAPQDRGTWGERQVDELFSGLFGRRMGLGEEDEDIEKSDDELGVAEQGLMLFRN